MSARNLRISFVAVAIVATLGRQGISEAQTRTYYSGSYANLSNVERANIVRAQMADRNNRYETTDPHMPVIDQKPIQLAQRTPNTLPRLGPIPEGEANAPGGPSLYASQTSSISQPIEREAGNAGVSIKRTGDEFAATIQRFQQKFKAEIDKHEPAPNLDVFKDAERVKLFKQMLELTVEKGHQVLQESHKLKVSFEAYRSAAFDAGPKFRRAEAYLKDKANKETVESAREIYLKASLNFAGRAARAELRKGEKIPQKFEEVTFKIERNTLACEEILRFLSYDQDAFAPTQTERDLADFNNAIAAIGEVLDLWTKKLVEDLEPPSESKPAPKPAPKDATKTAQK